MCEKEIVTRRKLEKEIEQRRQPGKENESTPLISNLIIKPKKENFKAKIKPSRKKVMLNKNKPNEVKITAFFKPIQAEDTRGVGRELNKSGLSCEMGLGCGDSGGEVQTGPSVGVGADGCDMIEANTRGSL